MSLCWKLEMKYDEVDKRDSEQFFETWKVISRGNKRPLGRELLYLLKSDYGEVLSNLECKSVVGIAYLSMWVRYHHIISCGEFICTHYLYAKNDFLEGYFSTGNRPLKIFFV